MELETDLLRGGIADRHRHAVDAAVNGEVGGRVRGAQRMIAANRERAREARERAAAVMVEWRGLAVDDGRRAVDRTAGFEHHRLVTEADTTLWVDRGQAVARLSLG